MAASSTLYVHLKVCVMSQGGKRITRMKTPTRTVSVTNPALNALHIDHICNKVHI